MLHHTCRILNKASRIIGLNDGRHAAPSLQGAGGQLPGGTAPVVRVAVLEAGWPHAQRPFIHLLLRRLPAAQRTAFQPIVASPNHFLDLPVAISF